MGRYLTQFFVLLAVVSVCACGPLPRPFEKASATSRTDLIHKPLPPVIAVNAVNGASIPMEKLLARSVADELSRRELIAYPGDKGSSTHVLDGWIESPAERGDNEPPSHILWALTTRAGELVHTFKYEFKATPLDWDFGSSQIIREIGEGTAVVIAEHLVGPQEIAEQSLNMKSGIWIRPVIDAPGDGNFSLVRAINYALADAGLEIVKEPSEAAFLLKAEVRVDSHDSDKQAVKIDWIVSGRENAEIGRATQENTVPAGTFDGRWGQTAVMIATAAAGSIREIVNREQNRRLEPENQGLLPRLNPAVIDETPTLPPPTLTPDPGPAN